MVDIAGRLTMKRIMLIGFILSMAFVFSVNAQNQTALEKRLAYLNYIPEISWVKFDGNNVYIGLNKVSPDLGSIVRGAAAYGNKAYGLGVHVWAVWETTNVPAIDFKYYCTATARHGKVQKSDCFLKIDERFEPSRRFEPK
jgi:hypothetical protein